MVSKHREESRSRATRFQSHLISIRDDIETKLKESEKKEQELIHASLTACCSLQEKVIQFLHAREEIEEARMRANGCP